MPCYTITTVKLDAGKMSPDLALQALKAMGLYVSLPIGADGTIQHNQGTYNPKTGLAVWSVARNNQAEAERLTAELRRQYSTAVVSQVKRYGWTVTKDARTGKLIATKRA